jgi:predicted MFS family arabinose efflux permease
VAGLIAQISLTLFWIVIGGFFLFAFYLIKFQTNFSIGYRLPQILKEINSTRIFVLIQGIWEALVFSFIPVYTLFFLKSPLQYGSFLAWLSFASIIGNLMLGKYTDKTKKRAVFLYPITLILAMLTFLFPWSTQDLLHWAVLTTAIQLVLPLFWNISLAMIVDTKPQIELAMAGRELILVTGRIIGTSMVLLSFLIEQTPFYLFFFLGAIMLLFPMVLFWRTRLAKQYSYL